MSSEMRERCSTISTII